MQVFLPTPDMDVSLRALDDARLRKQRVEAKQLIDTILERPTASGKIRKGWFNHPAAVMFRQYVPYLVHYYNRSLSIYAERGGNNIKLQPEPLHESPELPHWIADDAIHATHRSRLLFKGKMDVLADRIRQHTACRSVNTWLKQFAIPSINECRQPEWEAITRILDKRGAEQSQLDNHYHQFGWTESDTLEYLWPGEFPGEPNRLLR